MITLETMHHYKQMGALFTLDLRFQFDLWSLFDCFEEFLTVSKSITFFEYYRLHNFLLISINDFTYSKRVIIF